MEYKRGLFEKLISILETHSIRYAIVGNTEGYPDSIGSDVDMMLHPSDVGVFHSAIWEFNSLECTRVVQRIQHETVAFYYVIAHLDPEGVTFIQPDVCTDYHRNGVKLLSASEMLDDVVSAYHPDGKSKGFKILSPAKEFTYYLLKKIGKGAIDPKQFNHLRKAYQLDKEGAKNLISRFWGDESISCILQALEDNDFRVLAGRLKELRDNLHGRLHLSLDEFFTTLLLKIRRCLSPTGFVVSVSGISANDGAVIQRMVANLSGAFRRQRIIDVSGLGVVGKSSLMASVLKSKIMSTLVVIAGPRHLPLVQADVEVVFENNLAEASCCGNTISIPASSGELKAVQVVSGFIIEALSRRTLGRCSALHTGPEKSL